MRCREVELRADRNDPGRVHLPLASIIVALDLLDAYGLSNTRHLVEVAHIIRQVRKFRNVPPIALEVRVVDRIKAYQSAEQPPVRLRDGVSDQVTVLRQDLLNLVERVEDIAKGLLVGRLGGGKAGSIDAVIDVRVDQLVEAVDLGTQALRIVVSARVGKVIECRVENANNLRRLIVDDRLALFVPENRDAHAARIARIGEQIDL